MALISALMVTSLLTTLGVALAFLMTTETLISGNYRAGQETLYAADAGIGRVVADLRTRPDWDVVLAGVVVSGFNDGIMTPPAPDGTTVDLAQRTLRRQAESDARHGSSASNPNSPQWRLFAHADAWRLSSSTPIATPAYIVVWVADDDDERDGDPLADSNGVVLLRAEAFGPQGARRLVDATVSRDALTSQVRMLAWREVR